MSVETSEEKKTPISQARQTSKHKHYKIDLNSSIPIHLAKRER